MKFLILLTVIASSYFSINKFIEKDEKSLETKIASSKVILKNDLKEKVLDYGKNLEKSLWGEKEIALDKIWSISKSLNRPVKDSVAASYKTDLDLLIEKVDNEQVRALAEEVKDNINKNSKNFTIEPRDKVYKSGFYYPRLYAKNKKVPKEDLNSLTIFSTAKAFINSQNDSRTCTNITETNPSPTGDALNGSDLFTERTSKVVQLANQLGSAPKIFNYVKNFIKNIPVYGAAQTADQVINSKEGTFLDKSSLLIALLRAQGIAAEYKIGEALISEENMLKLYQVSDSSILADAHFNVLFDYFKKDGENQFNRMVYYRNGERTWATPYAWVNAYINNEWVLLDPSNFDQQDNITPDVSANDLPGASLINDWLSSEQRGTIIDKLVSDNQDIVNNGAILREGRINGVLRDNIVTGVNSAQSCLESQSSSIPSDYIFFGKVVLGPESSPLISVTLPVAEYRQGLVYSSHTAGLYGEVGGQNGLLQLKKNDTVLAQVSINSGTRYDQFRSFMATNRYGGFSSERRTSRYAGGVSVYTMSTFGANQKDIEEEVDLLVELKKQNASKAIRMARYLRLAGLMYLARTEELHRDVEILRGAKVRAFFEMDTFTTSGLLVGRDDRVFGEIPTLTTMDIGFFSPTRYFVDQIYQTKENTDGAIDEIRTIGSELEHLVWEELYGVPSASAVKAIQLAASDNPSRVILNATLNTQTAPSVFSQFSSEVSSMVSNLTDVLQANPEFQIYSNLDRVRNSDGWEGSGYITVGAQGPGAGSIIFSYARPRGSSRGGTSRANPVPVNQTDGTIPFGTSGNNVGCFSPNPVVISSGLMFHEFDDALVPGRTPNTNLKFMRVYQTNPTKTLGDLGANWSHNYEERLDIELSGNIVYYAETGGAWTYTKSGSSFIPPAGLFSELVEFADRYELREKGGVVKVFVKGDSLIPNGRLLIIRDPHGEEVNLTYLNGRVETVSTGLAGTMRFVRNGDNLIEQVLLERDGLTLTYNYDLNGKLTQFIDIDNSIEQYEYVTDMQGTQAQGLLEKIIDKNGDEDVRFTYYENGQVFEEITPLGGKQTYQYSPFLNNNFTRVRGENSATTEFRFDDQFRLTETVFPNRSRRSVEWNSQNLPTAITDELGAKTQFQYDTRGNRTGVKRPEYNGFSTITYDQTFDIPTQINPLVGSPTTITVNPANSDITKIVRVDNTGNVSLDFTHDVFGNILQTSNDFASYANVTNADGLLTTVFDARNGETRTYDSRGRLETRTFVSGRIITIGYNDFNLVTSITDTHGPNIVQTYDLLQRLETRTISGVGPDQVTTFEYDHRDRLTAIIDPANRRTEIEYELFSLNCSTVDKPTLIRDPAGRITRLVYDKMTRLVATIDPQDGTTKFEYNLRGDRISVEDPEGNRTRFEYDGNRRLTKRIRPVIRTGERNQPITANQETRFFYDQADRLLREEIDLLAKRNGTSTGKLVTELEYDELDRVKRKVIKEEFMGQTTIKDDSNFTYSRQLDVTRLATANNQTMDLTFNYEKLPPFSITGYITNAVQAGNPLGLIEGNFMVTPDLTGDVGAISKDGSTLYTKNYDPAGRLSKVTSNFAGQNYVVDILRDAIGRKENVNHSTGLSGVYSYDVLNRISNLTWNGAGENFSQTITYNTQTGNIDQILREIGSFTYTHDDLDQLTGVDYSGALNLGGLVENRTMSYDDSGNRIDDSYYGITENARNTILANNEWTYYTDRNGLGDIIQKSNQNEAHLFEYRGDKKLKKFTLLKNGEETQVEYYFDALGRRVAKDVKTPSESFTQTYAYEGDQDKILIGKNGSNQETLYVDGQEIDEHLAQVNTVEVKAYVSNHLGTILNSEATDQAKATGAFGEQLQTTPAISSTSNPVIYGFTGRQLDDEGSTYYYRNRQFDQESGKFLSQDPVGFNGGNYNISSYVLNRPLIANDPDGLVVVFLSFGGLFGGSEAPNRNNGAVRSLDAGVAFDTETFSFFGFQTQGRGGESVSGLFAGVGATAGFFPGTKDEFFGKGRELSANAGVGLLTAGFSTIESSGRRGFTVDLPFGFGVGGLGAIRNTSTTPFLFDTSANNFNSLSSPRNVNKDICRKN